ncbi:hypothetical protein [Tenacibaculum sp. M341]|uniref:hypothetical protein n=1 Tax=Tenacibaculum sp. M341 TaxID=2530339 RepID=UPI001A9CF191|nr:hypothetical protein [Tenacibaculum sp. M341]
MNIKNLNPNHSLSDKIIKEGKTPFKLWLEFEISCPWDDIENDFANIAVDTLDGRNYGINVWTYQFLQTAINEDRENGNNLNGLYQIPPDLFVKELSRNCIEKTIINLLETGNLEEVLNMSIFSLKYLPPYIDSIDIEDDEIEVLINELRFQLPDDHILQNEQFELAAKTTNSNDFIFKVDNEQIVAINLNLKSDKELNKQITTRIYNNEKDFWDKEMKQNLIEFKA